jgi:RNA polymerase sigma-70 factor (ECF subfamily)
MADPESTRWTLIRRAADGETAAREDFARLYEPVIRAYLGARWGRTPLYPLIDDAAQDAFVDCFRDGGALTRAISGQAGGFRAFLYGVVRNIARRIERTHYRDRERRRVDGPGLADFEAREEPLSKAFDRAWAESLVSQAADLMAERARERGPDSVRRVDLLRLRFSEGQPIREIAKAWHEEPATLHAEYRRARREFREALGEIIRHHDPSCAVEAEYKRIVAHLD